MSGDRRHYSPQFKLQVVLELLKGQKSAAQIAREHNIGQDLLSRWRDLFHERGAQIVHDGRTEANGDAARIAELERLVGGTGDAAHQRLGLPADASPDELRAAAVEALQRWQRRAEHPMTGYHLSVAARVAVRSVEGLLAALYATGQSLS